MNPKVYIETTIPSYLTARPTTNIVRAAKQKMTRDWWLNRIAYDLFVSAAVIRECSGGDPLAAADRIAAIRGVSVLGESDEADDLAELIFTTCRMPEKAVADAAHIATAAVNGMAYLLTWNCRHIANAVFKPLIEATCRSLGYEPPVICTPFELM